MPLLQRLTNAVGADLHAVLDRLEDPRTLLRQTLRDLAAQTDQEAVALQAVDDRIEARERSLTALDARIAELDDAIGLCLEESREDLARSAVREKLDVRWRRDRAAGQQEEDREARRRIADGLDQHRQELQQLRNRAEALDHRDGAGSDEVAAASIRDDEVEIALLAEIAARRAS